MNINPKEFQILPSEALQRFLHKVRSKEEEPIPLDIKGLVEMSFMSGAAWMFDIHVLGLSALSDDQAEDFMNRIQLDLETFAKEHKHL